MPKSPEQNQEIKDERREAILKSSLRLFAVRGYDATSINDITSASSCSHGLFYHYFVSKEEVFQTLIQDSLQKGNKPEFSETFSDQGASPSKLLRSILEHVLAELDKPKSDVPFYIYIFLNIHFQKTVPPPPLKSKNKAKSPFQKLADLIKRGQESGEFADGNPAEYAMSLFALLRGLTYVRVTLPENYHSPSIEILMNLFTRKEPSKCSN